MQWKLVIMENCRKIKIAMKNLSGQIVNGGISHKKMLSVDDSVGRSFSPGPLQISPYNLYGIWSFLTQVFIYFINKFYKIKHAALKAWPEEERIPRFVLWSKEDIRTDDFK